MSRSSLTVVLFLIVAYFTSATISFVCTENFCESVKCEPVQCGEKEISAKGVCGCCTICKKQLGIFNHYASHASVISTIKPALLSEENDPCTATLPFIIGGVVPGVQCAAGLICHNQVCTNPKNIIH